MRNESGTSRDWTKRRTRRTRGTAELMSPSSVDQQAPILTDARVGCSDRSSADEWHRPRRPSPWDGNISLNKYNHISLRWLGKVTQSVHEGTKNAGLHDGHRQTSKSTFSEANESHDALISNPTPVCIALVVVRGCPGPVILLLHIVRGRRRRGLRSIVSPPLRGGAPPPVRTSAASPPVSIPVGISVPVLSVVPLAVAVALPFTLDGSLPPTTPRAAGTVTVPTRRWRASVSTPHG